MFNRNEISSVINVCEVLQFVSRNQGNDSGGDCFVVIFSTPIHASKWVFFLCFYFKVFRMDHNLRNPDAELQQRAVEYLQLSRIASPDVLATVILLAI